MNGGGVAACAGGLAPRMAAIAEHTPCLFAALGACGGDIRIASQNLAAILRGNCARQPTFGIVPARPRRRCHHAIAPTTNTVSTCAEATS